MASTIPKTMKQWAIKGTNGFDDLQLQDGVAVPDVAPGEVLVKGVSLPARLHWQPSPRMRLAAAPRGEGLDVGRADSRQSTPSA